MSVNHDPIEFSMVRSPVWQGAIKPLTVDDDGEMNDSSWQEADLQIGVTYACIRPSADLHTHQSNDRFPTVASYASGKVAELCLRGHQLCCIDPGLQGSTVPAE